MVVREVYKGKKVLVTGGTGFIGKVLLEKFLRDVPDVGAVYIIVRTNNDNTARDRFEDDVVSSRVWDRMRAQRPDFNQFIKSKIIPIGGDLSLPNVGLSSEDLDFLVKNIDYVIHLAASIDFRERIDKAVESNIIGTQRIFNLAKRFHKLTAFVHCSTTYVNCNKYGPIEEKLPVFDFEPEDMVERIMKCETQNLEKLTNHLLKKYNYPNTYTFTKAIAELLIVKKRDGVPLILFRPSIVGAALSEPVPGWIDSVAAAAAPVLYLGVGLVNFIKGDPRLIADTVPVDLVANALIGCAVVIDGRDTLEIVQCGTSHRNPEIWHNWGFWAEEYWKHHVPKKAVTQNMTFMFHTNSIMYNAHFFMNYSGPSGLYSLYTSLFGNAKQRRDAERFKKMTRAAAMISETFEYFTSNEWIFKVTNLEKLFDERLSAEDRDIFSTDARRINWQMYLYYFCYGLHKYVLKEEGVTPPTGLLSTNIIINHDQQSKKNYIHWLFADLSWAWTHHFNPTQGLPVPPGTNDMIKKRVMASANIKDAMARVAADQKLTPAQVQKRANQIYERLASNMKSSTIRMMAWFLKKVWRRIYQGVHVDESGLIRLREALKTAPVVLIPTHRSYVDFLIISYMLFEYEMPLPRIAAGEDFLNIIIVRWILRNGGAFFLRRGFDGDVLYWSLFSEYVEELVREYIPVEFFIEGKRSRSGKALLPKNGMLNMVCSPYLNRQVDDLNIVPISFSYEKVLEGELYTQEMMGGSKTRESLNGLLRASKVLRMNFGRINIMIGETISIKEYAANFQAPAIAAPNTENALVPAMPAAAREVFDPYTNAEHKKTFVSYLGYKIIHILNKNLAITTTAILATVLLTYRRGISREELILKSDWLRSEIAARGAVIAFEGPTDVMVDYALKLLSNLISYRRHMYEPGQADQQSNGAFGNPNANYRKNILVLSYYRNQLLHLFQWDGIIACVMAGLCGIKSAKKYKKDDGSTCICVGGVDSKTLIEEARFLATLFAIEFVNTPDQDINEHINVALERMIERGFITCDTMDPDPGYVHTPSHLTMQTYYKITPRGEGRLTFLCHMFWPFVETYFAGCLTLFTLTSDGLKSTQLQQRMSWLAEKMYDEGKLNFFESCNMEILANAQSKFVEMGILQKKRNTDILDMKKKGGNKKPAASTVATPKEEPTIMIAAPYNIKNGPLQDLAKRIGKYRKTPPISKIKTNDLTRLIVEDFPLVAKL